LNEDTKTEKTSEEISNEIDKKIEEKLRKKNEKTSQTTYDYKEPSPPNVDKKEEKQVTKEAVEENVGKPDEYEKVSSGTDDNLGDKKTETANKETQSPEPSQKIETASENKEINQPASQPDLSEFRKKYSAHLNISDSDSLKTDETDKHRTPVEDKKTETPSRSAEVETSIVDRQTEESIEKPEKRSFFRKKKTPQLKEENEEEKASRTTIGLSAFRIEKIKEDDQEIEEVSGDKKVDLLEDETVTASDEISDAYTSEDVEHIFFDESDASLEGWTPRLTEEDKRKASLPLSAAPEVGSEHFKIADITLPKEMQAKSISIKDLGFSEEEWAELDFYPLREPFAYVELLREKETLDKRYFLVEIDLTTEERRILDFIMDTMNKLKIDTMDLETNGDDKYLMDMVAQVLKDYDIKLNDITRGKILYYIEKNALGLGKIDPLMKDPNIEDISCDGANIPIFLYHRQYGSLKSNIEFKSEEEVSSFVVKLAQKCGKHISIAEPMLDATMPDGSRVQMTLSDEVTAKGSTFTIRKFREDPFSPPDLVEFNTMSSEMIAYMWLAVENGINTLIAGGTASGKTTVLNALSLFIPQEMKIVSIEETREINLPHPNWIPGVSRSGFGEIVADKIVGEIDMYDLMKAALRQRPEYILVGEIRGREAYVLFQAMATGHATYSTVHADSPQSLIHRLEGKPINIPRVMLQSLDIVTLHVITRVKDKRARRCKQIIEIIDIDPTTKEILTNEVFRWDPVEDKFVYSGKSYVLERIRAEKDLTRDDMTNEIKNRMEIIEWMNTNNIREFREVAKVVAQYNEDPELVLKQLEKG